MRVTKIIVTVTTFLALCSWMGRGFADENQPQVGSSGESNSSVKHETHAEHGDLTRMDVERASGIRGMVVTNGEGKELGSVYDLMISTRSGDVRYAALGYGGFLGMGEKLFAVPWGVFQPHFDAKTGTHSLVLNIDVKTLKDAPGFDRYHWPDFADSKIPQAVEKHFETLRNRGIPSSEPANDSRKTRDNDVPVDLNRAAATDHSTDLAKDVVLRATTILNMVIKNPNDKELGLVNDIMIQMDTGKIRYVALSYGGMFGIGNKLFAVPWSELRTAYNPSHHNHFLVLSMDEVTLQKHPGFDRHHWPTSADPVFGSENVESPKDALRNVDSIPLME